jgi:hypothetical protein
MKSVAIITIFLIAASSSIFTGCSRTLDKNEVIVIKKTDTYHKVTCPPVNMAKTTIMTVAEAKADHYKPCPAFASDSVKTNGAHQ